MKKCIWCKQIKPYINFYKYGMYYKSWCKDCTNKYNTYANINEYINKKLLTK